MSVVVDTSVLIALHHLHLLGALRSLYGDVFVPQAVLVEWSAGSKELLGGSGRDWIQVRNVATPISSRRILGEGEKAAIALAIEVNADWIAIDDLPARKEAGERGLRVIGTIGILLEASKRTGDRFSIVPLIEALREINFHVSEDIISEIEEREREARS